MEAITSTTTSTTTATTPANKATSAGGGSGTKGSGGGTRFGSSTTAVPIFNNLPVKIPKQLSENKLKRLNILSFINGKKDILFTKKASKYEKERVWRQIFQKMLDFGMVTPQRDWRYVRDVSFSNWRKRAQKRIKHLASTGQRLNMDECEFLIYDILGYSPDKNNNTRTRGAVPLGEVPALLQAIGGGVPCPSLPPPPASPLATGAIIGAQGANVASLAAAAASPNLESSSNFEESDEYMIDSDAEGADHGQIMPTIEDEGEDDEDEDEDDEDEDEDDDDDEDDDELYDNMQLFIPKIVFDENPGQQHNSKPSFEGANSKLRQHLLQPHYPQCKMAQQQQQQQAKKVSTTMMANGNGHGRGHSHHRAMIHGRAPASSQYHTYRTSRMNNENDASDLDDVSNSISNVNTNTNVATCLAKVRELKLLELEIENKRLKNRFMKLKVWSMERSLGLEHSKEVREIGHALAKMSHNGANNNSNNKRTACGH